MQTCGREGEFLTHIWDPVGQLVQIWLNFLSRSKKDFSILFPLLVPRSYHLGYFGTYYQSSLPVYSSITHVPVALISVTQLNIF